MKPLLMILSLFAASIAFAQTQKADACCGDKAAKAVAANKAQCCKSTPTKAVAKGGPGCCNEKGQLAKFKVFVSGSYKFYGCEGSAKQARMDFIAQGLTVGKVQPVRSKITI